jgi:hypothetical protein
MLPLMLKKRHAIRPTGRKPNRKGWYNGSIIRDYFFKKYHHVSALEAEKFL